MKASLWAIVGIAGASAGGSSYMLLLDRNGASASASASDLVTVQQPASDHSRFATDLVRAPITAPMHANPFGSPVAAPKPAAAPLAAAPAPAVIPAFPYAYAGTLRKGREAAEVFLLSGKDLVLVKVGAVLEGAWRVEALTSDRIEVTYMPAGERLSMLLTALTGGSNAPAAAVAGSAVTNAYEALATASVEPAPVAVTPRERPESRIVPFGGRAVQPMAAVPGQPMAAVPGLSARVSMSGSSGDRLGTEVPASTARLGSEPPAQSSMPRGTAPSGTFQQGDVPTGKLGH